MHKKTKLLASPEENSFKLFYCVYASIIEQQQRYQQE